MRGSHRVPLGDEEGAQTVRVEERLGLVDAAAGLEGLEVAKVRPFGPDPLALSDEFVDAVSSEPLGLGGGRGGVGELVERDVGGDVGVASRKREGIVAPLVARVRAQSLAIEQFGSGGDAVVERHDAPSTEPAAGIVHPCGCVPQHR